jgi:putative ABC transport system ATP-binding protein
MRALEAFELYRFYHAGEDETFALRGVSLQLARGELVAVMGPSGSGKSTLLACLAGLDEPSGGHVEIMGRRLTRRPEAERAKLRARHIGVYPQTGNLFDHLSVEGNIRLQMRIAGGAGPDRLDGLLAALGLFDLRKSSTAQLSGGERARAGLAVALANDPDLLLADEPTAEVDRATELAIFDLFAARGAQGRATLVASHSRALASRADRLLVMQDGRFVDA